MVRPIHAPARQSTRFKTILTRADCQLPLSMNLMVSTLKVEKVVNAPKKPTVRGNIQLLGMASELNDIPSSTPKTRLPSIFTDRVP